MRKYICGNWKMHLSISEVRVLFSSLAKRAFNTEHTLAVAPSHVYLPIVADLARASSVEVVGQDVAAFSEGPYTGEVSAQMVAQFASAVILGHSERRRIFGDTDAMICAKLQLALQSGLQVILCCGENTQEYEAGLTKEVLTKQLKGALRGLDWHAIQGDVIIAYEPVWAIGTGKVASLEIIQSATTHIRSLFRGGEEKERVSQPQDFGGRVIYGGSVKASSAQDILALPQVDGLLVGGASLNAEEFLAIAGV